MCRRRIAPRRNRKRRRGHRRTGGGIYSPELDALIEQARAQNFDIAAAIARVRQADAQVRIAGAPLLPDFSGTGNASWQHEGLGTGSSSRIGISGGGGGSNASIDFHTYSAGLNASYELDFWGRNLAARRAAVASAMFSRFDQQTVALTVVDQRRQHLVHRPGAGRSAGRGAAESGATRSRCWR